MNYLYLVDNICYYKANKNNIYTVKYDDNVLLRGKVNNEKEFYKETYLFLKKNNLINIFLSQKVTVVTNPLYTDLDKKNLKEILEKLNYTNIYFISINELLDLKETNYIEYNQEYIFLYYLNEFNQFSYKYIPNNFFPTLSEQFKFIGNTLNINNNKTYTYGQIINSKYLDKIEKYLNKKIYYLENAGIYLLNICPK